MNKRIFTESDGIEDQILQNKHAVKMLEEVKRAAEKFSREPVMALDFRSFYTFYETGNREIFEAKYFNRRARLNAFTLLLFLYGDESYARALEDCIWAICDEYTWALPAHFPSTLSPEDAYEVIDLFSAETGFALCEVLRLVEEKIHPMVAERAKHEIKKRIVDSYLKNSFKWETERHNWAAVCAGSVGAIFLYFDQPQLIQTILPRILATMECYLQSLAGDGTCFEGYEYFKYGFGYFTYFSQLLYQYSGGEIDLFAHSKVEKTAQFPQKVILNYGKIINFADSVCDCWHLPGLSSFLAAKYDTVDMLPLEDCVSFGDDTEYRFAHFIRDFVWLAYYDGDKIQTTAHNKKYSYFPESELFVKTTNHYEFAAISGKNNVPHNHNDVGSFILRRHGDGVVEDLGKSLYCADYFNEKRYDFLTTSSRGHSVPIIGGTFQKPGDDFYGKVISADGNSFSLEMEHAYDYAPLRSLVRSFVLTDSKVSLCDTFLFAEPESNLVERITTCSEPEIVGEDVYVCGKKLGYRQEIWQAGVSSEIYTTICGDITAYLIDFTLKSAAKEAIFELAIEF